MLFPASNTNSLIALYRLFHTALFDAVESKAFGIRPTASSALFAHGARDWFVSSQDGFMPDDINATDRIERASNRLRELD